MRPTLNSAEVAELLGRSKEWLYRRWPALNRESGFPPPVLSDGELTWAAIHLHAWLDRELPPPLRHRVTAIRLAEDAVSLQAASARAEVAAWQDALAARFPRKGEAP